MQDISADRVQPALGDAHSGLKELLIALANNSRVGLVIRDRELRCTFVNEALARMNGLRPEAYIGRTVGDVLGSAAEKIERCYIQVLTTGKPILNLEFSVRFPARSEICHSVQTFFPLKDHLGQVCDVVTIAVEVTAEKQHEALRRKLESLERVNRGFEVPIPVPVRKPGLSVPGLLRSWKEIASFLATSVRTVQRWESDYNLPIHRLVESKGASVFAFTDELQAWLLAGISGPESRRTDPT